MPEGAALSWSFSDVVIRRKGRLAFGYRVPGCSLLYHGLRRDELCKLKVKDMQPRHGVAHLRVTGKGEKIRYVPLHLAAGERIHEYLEAAGHGEDASGDLFRPVRNNRTRRLDRAVTPDGVY